VGRFEEVSSETLEVLVTSVCRKTFEKTYRSFTEKVHFSGDFRFLVHVDVLTGARRYLPRLLRFLEEAAIPNPFINHGPSGHANAVNFLFKAVRTPLFLYLEDDWVFLHDIDLDPLVALMVGNKDVNQIRFSKEKLDNSPAVARQYEKVGLRLCLPGKQVRIEDTDLVESRIWALNPHLGRTSVAKRFTDMPQGVNPERYIWKEYHSSVEPAGLYILGKYGDDPHVKDIGRPPLLLKKLKTIVDILRNPYLIRRSNRIKKDMEYRGWHDPKWMN
jgi:hypothetical protein